MNFDEYLNNLPLLHTWDNGKTYNSGGFEPSHLRRLHDFLMEMLPSGPMTLETGAGNSTIALSFLEPTQHTVICPDRDVLDRLTRFFESGGMRTSHLDVRIGCSEWLLPDIAARTKEGGAPLHFALIDGGHNWPTVFVDFYYVNFMLREGGYLMIDDLQLHSVKELARMLVEQPEFELSLDLGKSLVFRKNTLERTLGEWDRSPYIERMSQDYARQPNPFAL